MAAFERRVRDLKQAEGDLLLSKHRDYGPDNIARAPGGPINGLAVRLHDKVARLTHLLETGVDPEHEALADTALDIANYGTILSLVLEGAWPGTGPADNGQLTIEIESDELHDLEQLSDTSAPSYDQNQLIGTLADVKQSATGVVGLDHGERYEGYPLLRQPVRWTPDRGWVTERGAVPDGWVAGRVTPYLPDIVPGTVAEVAPWSDPDKVGARGIVAHVGAPTGAIRFNTDGGRQFLLTHAELLPYPGGPLAYGDRVTLMGGSKRDWIVRNVGGPDSDGDIELESEDGIASYAKPGELIKIDTP